MIQRFSSRRQKLDHSFLLERLRDAQSYDRIAGYFNASMLEVAGEALELMSGRIRVVCNSDLNIKDVETAKAAQYAMRRAWCAGEPEKYPEASKTRFDRLYQFLASGKLEVKVLPNEAFGLIHGKAGVITLGDGRKTAFIGSSNETYQAWRLNYEILWEDESPEGVAWVQEEFEALWNSPFAVKLADFVIQDIGRLAERQVVHNLGEWRENPNPASPIVELPVYRQEYGLWEHQKFFIKLAFEAHQKPSGARYVLADMVGLGKTIQLALAAMLMALSGDGPILILVPKALLWQWQDEMRDLASMPSAVWTGRQWVDEHGIEHPVAGLEGILKCPRRIGIVSQGLITSKSEVGEYLRKTSYECVIVDESHRARRRNLGPTREGETPVPNNLLAFLLDIASRTHSLLLATATPVQLYPVEVWDLLNVLSIGNDCVLGNAWSHWRKPAEALSIVTERQELPSEDMELWGWVRNPLPPSSEHKDFYLIRRSLKVSDDEAVPPGDSWLHLPNPDKDRIRRMQPHFARDFNPFIRHIVRRSREYLETTIDPETNEPFLQPIKVELFGEEEGEAIRLPAYLEDAYQYAEEFCKLLSSRMKGAGFLKTLLLRRVGSTILAGRLTAERMLSTWQELPELDEEDEDGGIELQQLVSLTLEEKNRLQNFVDALNASQERDPKYLMVVEYLLKKNWLARGCIIFSQYFDSIEWLANQLSTEHLPEENIGLYAGGQKSGIILAGIFSPKSREELKLMVKTGELRLLLGTDAASEGLNLQRLGTLINLDLPWNPTRLEQRKGRIQRIGQLRDTVFVYNMRYQNSVEDRVHELLSERLQGIYSLFGQIPDVLEDVWINLALGEIERAKQTIDALPKQHPFVLKYHHLEKVEWESCASVLNDNERQRCLLRGW